MRTLVDYTPVCVLIGCPTCGQLISDDHRHEHLDYADRVARAKIRTAHTGLEFRPVDDHKLSDLNRRRAYHHTRRREGAET